MAKITLVGPRRLLLATLDLLHSDGSVHLDPFPIPEEHRASGALRPTPERPEGRALAGRVAALRERASRLRASLPRPAAAAPLPLWLLAESVRADDIRAALEQAEKEISPAAAAHLALTRESETLGRYQKVLTALYPLLQEVTESQRMELLGVVIERKRADVLPLLEKELSRITAGRYQLFNRVMDREHLAAVIAYPPALDAAVHELFSQENIAEIRLPESYSDLPLASTLRQLIRRLKELPGLVAGREKELSALSRAWYPVLSRLEEILLDRLDELSTVAMSAQGRHTFFLRGWVPRARAPRLAVAVAAAFGGDVLAETAPASRREFGSVPVDLRNGPLARFFEPLVRLLALPRYGTVDPTPYMAWFFPIFFGFILGDIGYGAVLLALSAFFLRRFAGDPFRRSLAGVLLLCGASAVVFGVLFGELFGNLGGLVGVRPLLVERATAFMPVLYASVAIGYLHISLGFALALFGGVRERAWRHQAGAAGNLLILAGLALALLCAAGLLPGILLPYGEWGAAAGLAAVVAGEGPMGVLDLLKTFGNILSYSRLMAIGTASVVLAQVANRIGGTEGHLILGAAVAVIFHVLNFVLGVFAPAIHSLRLHYVEFFGKFYRPGGRAYLPFRRHEVV
jgi:V/A-type H+/Na+-transporting ATPase subunit I